MQDPLVCVIIVSFNTRDLTLECLRALYDNLGSVTAEVIVVDNGSEDGSVEALRQNYPNVRVFSNIRNAGFGAANNQAMRAARGKYVMLLNSDAFVENGAIAAMIELIERSPGVGVVGPRLLNADLSLQLSCFPFPSPARAWIENLWLPAVFPHTSKIGDYRKWAHDEERLVDWVVGACMLVRREAYDAVGGFDERFFMYGEETDWQRRIRSKGWQIAFTPAARVKHLGGASSTGDKSAFNPHFFESLDLYELKHHGRIGLISLRAAMVCGGSMRAILWLIVWLAIPSRRLLARQKVRLHIALLWRQLTSWPEYSDVPGHRAIA